MSEEGVHVVCTVRVSTLPTAVNRSRFSHDDLIAVRLSCRYTVVSVLPDHYATVDSKARFPLPEITARVDGNRFQ